MSKLITVGGRTLEQTSPSHPTLTYTITETDTPAERTTGGDNPVLIQQIALQCNCSDDYVANTSTFVGSGAAAIVAHTSKVTCEGQSIILEGDEVLITCEGTITVTSSGVSSPGAATVTVRIANTNQSTIIASEA